MNVVIPMDIVRGSLSFDMASFLVISKIDCNTSLTIISEAGKELS